MKTLRSAYRFYCLAYSFAFNRSTIVGCHTNTEGFSFMSATSTGIPAPSQVRDTPHATETERAGSVRGRIALLRLAIERNRDVAKSCDADYRNQLLILANEMEDYLRSLITRLPESKAE